MSYISAELRRIVFERAGGCCEYCLTNQADRYISFEIDHIISIKHGGATVIDNLCLSCNHCNELKGSDIASADPYSGKAIFLFHPRRQRWDEHFRLNGAYIEPLTPEGRVTVLVLWLNMSARIIERDLLLQVGTYPCQIPSG
jgi:hypothetical protein